MGLFPLRRHILFPGLKHSSSTSCYKERCPQGISCWAVGFILRFRTLKLSSVFLVEYWKPTSTSWIHKCSEVHIICYHIVFELELDGVREGVYKGSLLRDLGWLYGSRLPLFVCVCFNTIIPRILQGKLWQRSIFVQEVTVEIRPVLGSLCLDSLINYILISSVSIWWRNHWDRLTWNDTLYTTLPRVTFLVPFIAI